MNDAIDPNPGPSGDALARVAAEARACRICVASLPLGPRPVLQVSATARLLIIGQAPGSAVHRSGVPWDDRSGARLCSWLGIDGAMLHDAARVAHLPTGLCYPGVLPGGGDRRPMPVCAPTWHPRLLPLMPEVALTLLVGGSAQALVLGPGSVAARVRDFRRHLPARLPLPHPSWRTVGWERRNPWFEAELLPELRARLAVLLR